MHPAGYFPAKDRSKRQWVQLSLCAATLLALAAALLAQQPGLGNDVDAVVDYYSSVGLEDPVTKLQSELLSGKKRLEFEPGHGYLISLLKELKVPISSQLLVWSKTSSQADHTSPTTPRALYFNDDVYIGWAKDDAVLDLIAIDPRKGPIFFTLDQRKRSSPFFARDSRCLNCHFSGKTLDVPGLIVRSVFAKPDGIATAQLSSFVAGHNNPLSQRWGGWYVTGTHGQDTHMGNAFLDQQDSDHLDLKPTSNLINLSQKFDTSPYLSPHSDTVALLLLDDLVRMENLLARARFQALHAIHDPVMKNEAPDYRQKLIARAAEPLLVYMLFRDEAPLHGPIAGTTNFAQQFARQGPYDRKGRSLRELDLKTRLFKYPCHYRIYSPGFDAMPQQMKDYIWKRLSEILTGKDQNPIYKSMTTDDRADVLQILIDTKPEFRNWLTRFQKLSKLGAEPVQ